MANFLKNPFVSAQNVSDDKDSRIGDRLLAEVRGKTRMLRRVLIVSLALIVLASGFVVALGPARLHPPALKAVHPQLSLRLHLLVKVSVAMPLSVPFFPYALLLGTSDQYLTPL